MVKNYFKLALRNLFKSRSTAFINIGGLTIGFLCALLIFTYIKKELSYDRFHSNIDHIYRVLTIDEALGVTSNLVGITLPALSETMKNELTTVENSVRISYNGRSLVEYNKVPLYTENMVYVEPSLFEIFDYELVAGHQPTALQAPNTTVLTETMAKKIFSKEDPIGKTIKIDNSTDLEVVGVMKDPSPFTSMEFDLLVSMVPTESDSNTINYLNSWSSISMVEYVSLSPSANIAEVKTKMEEIIRNNNVGDNFKVTLQPLSETHLSSSGILFDIFNANKGDINYLYTLAIVGLFVVLIAAFNFMNLSTARSANRAKEVGMRKVMGASKRQLALQFLSESVVICFFSLILSLVGLFVTSSFLDFGIDQNLFIYLIGDTTTVLWMIGSVLSLGVIAGLYPAFLLSGFSILKVLKGNFKTGTSGVWLRKVLVVVQFTASIAMIIGTITVYYQLDYLKSADKGFDDAQILSINLGDQSLRATGERFKNRLAQIPDIETMGLSGSMPGRQVGRTGMLPEGSDENDVWIVSTMGINHEYFDLMGMEMVAGRNYSKEIKSDSAAAIIMNEAAVKAIGWDDPIGKKISQGPNEKTVIGVVKNFHFANMRHQIEPIILPYQPTALSNGVLSLKIRQENLKNTLQKVEEIWAEVNPNYPFEYVFFNEEFGRQYENDENFASLIVSFTWLAIFIACLGLIGLSMFTAEQRIKEIGIRKVLGANIKTVVLLLSTEFTKPVLAACLIATPIAYYFLNEWLSGFAYHVDMPWIAFVLASLLAVIISQLTVSFHAIKAATSNPVHALRNE
ncbi:putative ABC transport system permease protein [Reichenbachiella faecimaris]|uniref:Putative ABC transport system permease protein n=1 Tax=Reichenbachiella faecimaris TaxID=692418 RepID=A0A1W2GF42_REIFA|nr:ABC transporter permease [Reichenbachiella faecimaris]SMD35267.1 putative ABC transport system permease protein [Reichenbachiella faecimaris]